MYKILSELMDGVAQAYGDTAKAMKGTQDLPKAPVPDVRHLLIGRSTKDPQAFFGLKEKPFRVMPWRGWTLTREPSPARLPHPFPATTGCAWCGRNTATKSPGPRSSSCTVW